MSEEKRYRVNASVPASALDKLKKVYAIESKKAEKENRLNPSKSSTVGMIIVKGLQVHFFQQSEGFHQIYTRECEKALKEGREKPAQCDVLSLILMKGLTKILTEK